MTREETAKGLKTMVKDKGLWRSNRYYAMVCKNALEILRKEEKEEMHKFKMESDRGDVKETVT